MATPKKVEMRATNVQTLNTIRSNASISYQERIPEATEANLVATSRMIREFTPFWNEFMNLLLNKITLTIFNENQFKNRLAPLKSGTLAYGGMVQEIGADLIEAEAYDADATNVFDAEKPDIHVNYHRINRRDMYPMKLNEDLLAEAMENEGQLSAFINRMLELPNQSAEWDEYLLMRDLLGTYQETDGFANVQVPNLLTSTDPEADGKTITKKLREMYLKMHGFYNTAYNPEGVPAVSSDLILLGTPEFFATLDVDVLASAYNMDKADFMADKTIVIDQFPEALAETQAMLIDSDFYKVFDTKRKMTNMYNPRGDYWVHYLHVWQILSVSRMVNALRFSTSAENITPITVRTVSEVTTAGPVETVANNAVLEPGAVIPLTATVKYTGGYTDNNAFFNITQVSNSKVTDNGEASVIYPDASTYIDRNGVLHVGDMDTYDTITVTAFASKDPSIFLSFTLNVVGYEPPKE